MGIRGNCGYSIGDGLTGFSTLSIRAVVILLIGGDKTGKNRWYEDYVPTADRIYDEHVAQLKREGSI